jgi:hypothetical protein
MCPSNHVINSGSIAPAKDVLLSSNSRCLPAFSGGQFALHLSFINDLKWFIKLSVTSHVFIKYLNFQSMICGFSTSTFLSLKERFKVKSMACKSAVETLCRALMQQAVSSHRAQFYAYIYVNALYWHRIISLSKLSTSIFLLQWTSVFSGASNNPSGWFFPFLYYFSDLRYTHRHNPH